MPSAPDARHDVLMDDPRHHDVRQDDPGHHDVRKDDPRYHDVRQERVGGFAGPVYPAAPFGKYTGPPRRRWQAAGGFAGTPDRQRQGSFADVELHRHRRGRH